ncbi:MAG: glycosyltransferase family 4 protein [Daejeonella sp.]|uniref:glycosyltransferase family 4 protein n=1 Tax=Daejeonella sp. TaxID=2805397 RepID=UPI002736D206|nr:glycosyltransferase family 4 protein [Daejeonella sp.]MDP3467508.1 glycosyltransferase family 4 protein [Daejeonella sp.]
MNILFLSIVRFSNIDDRGIYMDLIRKFMSENHSVYVVYPSERRNKEKTGLTSAGHLKLLKVRTMNFQKTGFIEKGLATLMLERQFLHQIKRYFKDVHFDLVLYSTPPITFTKAVSYIKNRDNATTYLLLKDIFPQNAVDLGLFKKNGLLHKFFLKKERELYEVSDFIGCMSPANVDFVIKQNPQIDEYKVEINPNSIEPLLALICEEERNLVRRQYGIPDEVAAFIYGGNLGKPQGVNFLIEVLISNKENRSVFFVIVGDGTEYSAINKAVRLHQIGNVILMKSLIKPEYDKLLQACDVGLIFLDRRFTVPNYPSRLLSYLEVRMPVLSAIDLSTDLGTIMERNKYGYWVESGDFKAFNYYLDMLASDKDKCKVMGENGYQFLLENYLVEHSYNKIMSKFPNV